MPKIDRASRARRSGVVITSTIALALGGAAIVAPSTAAAENVRYTDTDKPVAPKTSELNESTLKCGVTLTDTDSSNSGLSYERRVPNKANPKDPIFGIQVTANTSGERTFNYLNVVDGPKNPPIPSGTVTLPPLQPGETIGQPATGTVNYVDDVPNMVIKPPARGETAREIRTTMDLTEGQVDQIANGGMTIGWAGQYNAGMTSKNEFFFSDNGKFLVNGVVNPWPSENADCSPITIEWADQLDTAKYEGTVIQPGETVKVGTVSADEDSVERLRFIAKDPDGNVVPGEITREGNDIYWTMADYIEGQPAYTQTDKLTFEMIAMPRDLEGLKQAAEENGSLPETVVDSSLAPERYRSAETIATNTFDIDDAKNHDPNYDSRQESITSGVANNAPTEERQTRTFANVADSNGDTLADLVTKYNAEIELDDSNVYEGWDAYFRDPDNGDYTVVVESPAGTDARPGSFAQPIVKVTYSNGTQDIIPLLVIVDPNNTQTTDVVYPPETIRGIIGATMTSPAPTLKRVIGKNQKPVKPASYTVDPETVPAGWTIEVAPDGAVTAKSPADAEAGDMASPKIIATYPDGTIDEQELSFLVGDDASLNNPKYPVEVTKPGAPATHQIQNVPEGSTFTLDNDVVDGWTYSIDPKTGAVTVTPPAGAKGGDKQTNTVTVTYPDGTTDTVQVDTVVAHSFNYEAEPHYPQETAYPGEQINSPLSVDKPDEVGYAAEKPFVIVPGANFTATGQNNEFGNPTYTVSTLNGDWTVSLDNEGNVISQIPETAKKGDSISVPVNVTYEDNSTDETTAVITVEDNPTREVPFDVEYNFDLNIPAGQYRVMNEGVAGEEKQQRDGTWKRTTEPVNEVVHIGIKPATASDSVEWIQLIPYSTIVRPNAALAPGETKVVQVGEDGIAGYKATFTATGGEATVEETQARQEPTDRIVEYGPRLDDQELVTETTRKIPFDTQIIPDDTLAAGTQVVDKQGVVGVETVTSTQKLVDGKPSGDPVVEPTTVTEKQDAVIRVGTKTEGTNAVEHTEPVPYETKVEYDPTLAAGEYKVVTPGKAGEKTVEVTQTIVNSKVTGTKREETVTTKPTDEVIKVGTKQATATDKVEWKEPIPFSTVVRPNPDLKPGEVVTVQEGVNGEATYTATFEGTNGQATVTESKSRTEPTDKIVEYGPTIADQTLTTTTTNPVPFNTAFVADPTLAVGEQVVDKQGENGVDTVTATQEIKDGQPVGEPTITTQRTKEPVDAVVRVGTKTEGQAVSSVETVIPFEVEVVYDPTLAPGEQKVTQEGVPGTKKVTVTQPVVNSQPNGEATTTEETVTEPTKKIIAVGTKPAEASNQVTWTVDTPYNTVVRPNPELKPGEVKTVQEGEYGQKKYTADFKSVGADSTVTPTEEETKPPKNQIIEYGPTIDDQKLTSTTTRPIEFETEFVPDDTLPTGEQKVDQQGENGEEKITSTQEIKDGKPVGEPTITTEVTKPVKKAIIRVGVKAVTTTATTTEVTTSAVPTTVNTTTTATSTVMPAPATTTVTEKPAPATTTVTEKPAPVTETVTVPFTTKTVWDPTLEPGQEIEDVAGVDGKVQVTVADGKSKVETVTNPVQRVVRVGSKPADGVEWTEETPFKVTVVLDAQLEAGKYETVQEGKPGRVIHRADGTEETTAATDHIIKVGTYKVITNPFEFTSVQPFGTTVRPNFKLEPGERKIVQEGKAGLVRYRIDIKTGEVVKLEDSAAVERIVEYGPDDSDDKAVTTVTRPVPFDTEVIEDPNLPEGTQVIAQGEVGEEVVTTVQGLKDGRPFGDPITTAKQTVAPTNAVIRVGTKKPDAPQPLPDFERIVELPFTTKIVWDPTLEPGVEVEDVKGAAGQVKIQVVNGEPTVNTVKEPVQRVVRVGSKPADDVEWTEEIPFQVQVRQNPELTRGESRVVQDGVPGLKRYVNGKGEVVTEPVDYIFEIGTKDLVAELTYSPVTLRPGQTADVEPSTGHVEGNRYRKLEWPEGWEGSVDPDTGKLRVTPPADAKPGTKVKLPVEVTDADGNTSTFEMEVTVADGEAVPTPTPEDDKASSDKARRCLANAFAANSPFLWLLPLGILGAVGYGVNEAFGPQIQQLNARFDEAVRRNMPDFGVGHGVEKPEFVREIEGQVNAINQRFAPVAEQLQPVGIALGAIALLSLTGVLVAQACSEDGFDNGLTVLGSSKDDNTAESARSSKK